MSTREQAASFTVLRGKKANAAGKKHEEIEEQVTHPKRGHVMRQEISHRISPINKSAVTTKGKEKTEPKEKEKEEEDSGEREMNRFPTKEGSVVIVSYIYSSELHSDEKVDADGQQSRSAIEKIETLVKTKASG